MEYQYVRIIGQGGLGQVSLYLDQNGSRCAIKHMLNQWDDGHYQRFVREIKLMANLVHRGIMRVTDFNIKSNSPFYVMPYYEDGSLRDRLNDMKSRGKIFSPSGATSIIFELLEALEFAHKSGAIHRDLKPENIVFNGLQPIIADWGIGKFIHKNSKVLTGSGPLGTKSYCAPEQWTCGQSDERSDIYALGVIFRELLTGKIHGKISDTRLDAIINKMTAASPDDRYQKIQDVKAALRPTAPAPKMDSFWQDLLIAGAVAGGIALLIKALDD